MTLTQANLDKIHENMTAQEVKAILGEPNESKTEPIPIVGGTKTTYTYENKNSQVTIVLKNDSVQTKEGHFGTPQ
ncbi:MAG TPA: outer membrane protein assembly factor BamE [Chthoniobacteraceae bacterium]|nr:outer membrane protein assembly factor BamE [Chthoniobacteraceae bacterium]